MPWQTPAAEARDSRNLMRKGFTRNPDPGPVPATRIKNYITPAGLQRLIDERRFLLTRERPAVTQVVAWAAGNGDRSENADYQYGKRRLREIDRRIRFLTKRIDAAEVVDPEGSRSGRSATHAFFGATVRYVNDAGAERVVRIVGVDEVDLDRNYISWVSPLARALMKSSHQCGSAPSGSSLLSPSGTLSGVNVTSSPGCRSIHDPTRVFCQSSLFLLAPTPMPAAAVTSMNSPGASRYGASRERVVQ